MEEGTGNEEDTTVRVAVRCRPFNSREKANGESSCVKIRSDQVVLVNPAGNNEEHSFAFDLVIDENATQESVWTNVGVPILNKAFNGYNGTIFAYGQTGSGKTWSMQGAEGSDLEGIIPRMNNKLFERIDSETKMRPTVQFLITVSYFEIYNEVIFDLLDSSDRKKRSATAKGGLEIKEHPVLGVYVKGLQELVVDSASKLQSMIDQGMRNRTVASTQMNADSSRSHSVFIINLHQKDVEDETKNVFAKVNLVDLAGSERVKSTGATGSTLKEGANINKSLSALGNVINALVEASKGKGAFIPYRNSKLTRVLQESLGGNSVTAMLAALSPAACNFEETLSTLKYANRAKAIKVKAVKNEQSNQVSKLNEEIRLLKEKLLSQVSSSTANGQPQENNNSVLDEKNRQRLKDLEEAMRSTWEAKSKMSEEYERDRQALLIEQQNAARQFEAARQRNWALLEQKGDLEVTLGHVRSLVTDRLAQSPVAVLLAQWTEGLKEVAVLGRRLVEQDTVVQVYRSTLERDSQALVQQQCGRNPGGVVVYDSTAFSMLRQLREKVSVTHKEMVKWTSLQDQLLTQIRAVIQLMKTAGTSRAILNQTAAALHSTVPETSVDTGLTKDERKELHRGLGLVRRQMQYKLQQSNQTVAVSRRTFVNFDALRLDFVKLLSIYDSATAEDAGLAVPDSAETDPTAVDILQGLRSQAQTMRAKLESGASRLVEVFDRLEQSLLAAERELVHVPSAVSLSPTTANSISDAAVSEEDVPLEGVTIENFTAECLETVRTGASSSVRIGSSSTSVPASIIGIDSPQCWSFPSSTGADTGLLLSFPSVQTLRSLQLQGGKCTATTKSDASMSASASAASLIPTPLQALSAAELLTATTLPCGLTLNTLEPRQEVTSAALADVLDWTALIKNNPPEKFLKRPPVRFLFDLVKFIGANNQGFLEEPLLSADWAVVGADKNSKLEFMETLIQFITRKVHASAPATTASAIVTGSDPELTNLMLQQLAIAVYAHHSQGQQAVDAASGLHSVKSSPPPRAPQRVVQNSWVTVLRVEASEDGTTWEVAAELNTGLSGAAEGATLPLPKAVQCRYLRLTPLHWKDEGRCGAALRLTLLGPEVASDNEGDGAATSQLTAVMPLQSDTLTAVVETLLHTLSTLIEAVEFVSRKEDGHKELKQLEVKKNMENLARDKLALEALLANEKKSLETDNQDLAERLKACFSQLKETQGLLEKEQEINQQLEQQRILVETEKTDLLNSLEKKTEENVKLRAEILSFQAALEKEKSSTESLQSKVVELEGQVETLQDQLQQGEEARLTNETEKEEFLNQIAILTEERDGARAQEEELFEKLGEKTIDLDRLRESYVEITDRWNDSQDEAMDLRDKIDSLQAMLETRSFLHHNSTASTAPSVTHSYEPAPAPAPLTAPLAASLSAEASPKFLPTQEGHQSPRRAGSKGTRAVPPTDEQRTSKSSPRASRETRQYSSAEDCSGQLVADSKTTSSLPFSDRAPPRRDDYCQFSNAGVSNSIEQSNLRQPPPAPVSTTQQSQQQQANNNEYGDEYFEEYDEEFETDD